MSGSAGVSVTALLAGRGLLWVGTNVGIALTIPLPRLEGVPIISGRVNISYHAHFGPITFLLALQPRPTRTSRVQAQPDDTPVQEEQPAELQKVCCETKLCREFSWSFSCKSIFMHWFFVLLS